MMAYGRGFNSPRLHHNVKSQPLSGWDFFCPFPLCCGAVSRVGLLSTLRRAQIRVERHQSRNLLARGLVVCFGVDRAESMFSSVAGQAIATVSASTASYSLWVPTNFTRTNWVESNHEQGGQQPDLPSSFGLNQASTPSSRWRTPPARAPRRFVWKPTATIGGGRSAVWACGQVAERLVHMPMRPCSA
jgi:hypothetical protein